MSARASRRIFWDEEFAWEPREGREGGLPATRPFDHSAPEPGTVVTLRIRRPRRQAGRRVRVRATPRLLRAAGVAVSVATTLLVSAVVIPDERPGPQPKERTKAAAPPSAGAPVPAPVNEPIRIGDRGEAVRALQQTLIALRFQAGQADGRFEGGTRDAIVAFQQAHGLDVDGVVGPETAEALREAVAERARSQAARARRGLRAAIARDRLSTEAGTRYDSILTRVLAQLEEMPLPGAANVAAVLDDVAVHSPVYDEPRALTLFSMLETNARYLQAHGPPRERGDIEGEDGTVYRFVSARGFQFHPLANFAALNRHVSRGRASEARRLAAALVARGVPDGDALVWEYYFPFGGPPRWTSGFAQAIAAESLARAGALVADPSLLEAAKSAFRAIPDDLALEVAGGAWVREYGFSDIVILNAQLQSLLSLSRYAATSGDLEVRAFAGELETASRALLPRFDTGCWSLYALGGGVAPPHYHRYHIALLERLDATTGEPPWGEVARRWKRSC